MLVWLQERSLLLTQILDLATDGFVVTFCLSPFFCMNMPVLCAMGIMVYSFAFSYVKTQYNLNNRTKVTVKISEHVSLGDTQSYLLQLKTISPCQGKPLTGFVVRIISSILLSIFHNCFLKFNLALELCRFICIVLQLCIE